MINEKSIGYVVVALVAVVLTVAGWMYFQQQEMVTKIATFEDCAAAGYPIMDSYPEQCRTPDGRTFVRDVSNDPNAPANLGQGQPIQIEGELVCLPHRNTDGPTTLECAFGLIDMNGTYYALRDTDPNYSNVSQPMGEPMMVEGFFTAQEDQRYQSIGIIEVTSITPAQ